MSIAELTDRIMALPPNERAAIAQKVWESIEDEHVAIAPSSEAEAIAEARRRDEQLSQGNVTERPHKNVMADARRALRCE